MKLEETIIRILKDAITKKAAERELTEEEIRNFIDAAIKGVLSDGLEKASDIVSDTLRQQIPLMVQQEQEQQTAFEERLYARWKKALDLYDATIMLTRECGDTYLKQYQEQSSQENDLIFGVLMHIHFKACQVAAAIGVLLKSGYASDALSRQRTLYELAVTAYFIKKHGQETAERYWLHDTIESYKAAMQYQDYYEKLKLEPPDLSKFEAIRIKKEELISRFGKVYNEQYGWAAEALKKKAGIRFADIETDVAFDHMRPYYRMASHGVHANPKGLIFNIGNIHNATPGSGISPFSGASNAGLADPGELALISLYQCSAVFFTVKNDFDMLQRIKVLDRFAQEGCQAFSNIHLQLVREEQEESKTKKEL